MSQALARAEASQSTISIPTGSLNTFYLVFPILACLGQAWASQRFNLYRAYEWATPITGLVVGAAMNRSFGISLEALIEVPVPERIVRQGPIEVGEMLTWLIERPLYGIEAGEQMCDALRRRDVTAFARTLGMADKITYLDLNGLDRGIAEQLKTLFPDAYCAPKEVPVVAAKNRDPIDGPLEVVYGQVKSECARDYQRGVWNFWRARRDEIVYFDVPAAMAGLHGNGAYALAALCKHLKRVVVFEEHAARVIANKHGLEALTIGIRKDKQQSDWLSVLPKACHELKIVSAIELDGILDRQLEQHGFDGLEESRDADGNWVYDYRKADEDRSMVFSASGLRGLLDNSDFYPTGGADSLDDTTDFE